jgi:hypothetical protein
MLVQRLDRPGAIIGAGYFGLRRLVVEDGVPRWLAVPPRE